MSATNQFETALLGLIFTNTDAANVGDATGLRGSSTAGVFWISLHTSNPGEAGAQDTNEAAYTPYARQSVARSTAGWTVTGDIADNDSPIQYPEATAGSETLSHFGLGSDETGVGNLNIIGALGASLAVSAGIQPEFAAGALDVSLD